MEFILIAAAHFMALLSPGPDFFLIIQASLRMPLRYGLALCFGIASANGVYLITAVAGVEIIRESELLFTLLKYAGAAYLLFLGVMLLRSPKQSFKDNGIKTSGLLSGDHTGHQFLTGFMSAILNPKNAIFYLSLFTVMVSPETGFFTRCLYGLWMTGVVLIWDCCILAVIGRGGIRKLSGSGIFYIEKIAGAALALFGILLPFT